jgi:hypothetical protein
VLLVDDQELGVEVAVGTLVTQRPQPRPLGNLKTAYSGTYHAFDFSKYADRYLAEVQYRFKPPFRLGGHSRAIAQGLGANPAPP